MDYEKKYKEALEWARKVMQGKVGFVLDEVLEKFPELKESEDEKIRKAIHIYLDWLDGRKDCAPKGEYTIRDMIAWILKQGEHANFRNKIEIGDKVTRNEDGVLVNLSQLNRVAKPADNVIKPKFRKGDWIIHQGTENIYQVVAVIDNQYQLKYGDNYTVQKCADVDRCARLYDVTQDAKNGDVLFIGIDGSTCIFKKLKGNLLYSYIISDGKLLVEDSHYYYETSDNVHPATKEQRDLLFQKMKEAGYEWSSEEKKLKKVEQKPAWSEEDELHIRELESLVKQVWAKAERENDKDKIHKMGNLSFFLKTLKPQLKQEWCEEDEKMVGQIIEASFDYYDKKKEEKLYAWLETLKNRVQPQPKQEWSEEDAKVLNRISAILIDASEVKNWWKEYRLIEKDEMIRLTDFLKSLRPQTQWKPSDEQMNALHYVTNFDYGGHKATLVSLYEQLKKLRKE